MIPHAPRLRSGLFFGGAASVEGFLWRFLKPAWGVCKLMSQHLYLVQEIIPAPRVQIPSPPPWGCSSVVERGTHAKALPMPFPAGLFFDAQNWHPNWHRTGSYRVGLARMAVIAEV